MTKNSKLTSDLISNLLEKGIENIYPSKEEFLKRLQSNKKIKIYLGIDPTGPSLHLGHGAVLLKLKRLQDLGHKIIILIGDFTAQIGDPTDKMATRKQLTHKQVLANCRRYKEQIGKILDLKKTEFRFNNDWLGKMKFAEVLRLASEFTVSQMLERDMFEKRLEAGEPIYLHEFLYPLMQGYDSVAMGVEAEIGGNDQTFNMLAGRTMLKRRGKEKFVLTVKLLTDPTGKKMGKSEGNMVVLNDQPEEMYGKIMSWPDSIIDLAFEVCTNFSLKEIAELPKDKPKENKMCLAREIVKIYYDEKKAKIAEEAFVQAFQNKEIPSDLKELKTLKGKLLSEILVEFKVIDSKTEFKRLIGEGAIKIDGEESIKDIFFKIEKELILKIGKKRFVKILI